MLTMAPCARPESKAPCLCWTGTEFLRIFLLRLLFCSCCWGATQATIVISSEWNPHVSGVYVRGVDLKHEKAFAKASTTSTSVVGSERLDLWLYSFDRGIEGFRWLIGTDIHDDNALTYMDTWSGTDPCAGNNHSTRPDSLWMIHKEGQWQPDHTFSMTCHGFDLGGVEACLTTNNASSSMEDGVVPCVELVGSGDDGNPVKMPVVMLGTAYIGASHGAGVENPEVVEPPPAIDLALDNNYQGLDLGSQIHPAYANERLVGELLAQRPNRRKSIFITTKLSPSEHGYHSTLRAVQRSLQLLRTDTIDLFLIHHPQCLMADHCEGDWTESWRAMERLLAIGAVRAIGVSNFDYNLLHHLVGGDGHAHHGIARAPVSLLQNRADPLALEDPNVLRLCQEHNINYQAFSLLGRQWIVGPWSDFWKAPTHPVLGHVHVRAIAERLSHESADEKGRKTTVTSAQVILRWAIQKGWTVVPKTAKADRLDSNRRVFHFELTELDMEIIDSLKPPPKPDGQEL
jgi:diketogulonate reductase-like aldo/keto reductase